MSVVARIPDCGQPRRHERGREDDGGRSRDGDQDVFDDVERAIAEIAAGRPVVVADDAARENEGDVVFAAAKATPELLAFTIRHARGLICAPMLGEDLDRLRLPQMTDDNTEHMRTAFTVSVDARDGITTGISAADRARTIRLLADRGTSAAELVRPGHLFPLRYAEGGVLRRPGHTEAAVDLARLAGLVPAGVVAEVINDDGTMARLPRLREFATEHGLALISIAQLIDYRRRTENVISRVAQTQIPNAYGEWQAFGYLNQADGTEFVALVLGGIEDGAGVLTRVHSECLTGDVLGSLRCDCGAQLDAAMAAIASEGRGVVLYMRGHEGRGIGLMSKLRAYQLQDSGADTVDANLELGLPVDAREYSAAAQILADLGVRSVRLLTNNPAKVDGLTRHGAEVAGRVPLPVPVTPHNLRYLTAKRDRLGHEIDNIPQPNGRPASAARLPASDHGPFEPVRAARECVPPVGPATAGLAPAGAAGSPGAAGTTAGVAGHASIRQQSVSGDGGNHAGAGKREQRGQHVAAPHGPSPGAEQHSEQESA